MKLEDFTPGKEFQVYRDIFYRDECVGVFHIPKGIRVIVKSRSGSEVEFYEKQSGMSFSVNWSYSNIYMLDSFYPI